MAPTRTPASRLVASLSPWLGATAEHSETFRFEALTLLESAKTKLAEIEAKPPADASSTSVAVLHPMHLAVKALLAAKGVKARSTRATLELLPALYAGALPAERIADYVGVQRLEIQGAKAIEATRALLTVAGSLL